MGECLYNTFGGTCQFYEEDMGDVKNIFETDYGFVGKGACVVEDDEDPYYNCSSYEPKDPFEDDCAFVNDDEN